MELSEETERELCEALAQGYAGKEWRGIDIRKWANGIEWERESDQLELDLGTR
jgi:hypothetical protein